MSARPPRLGTLDAGARQPSGRRCRPRRLDPAGPRPSDLLGAFFAAGLAMLVAAAAAGVAYALSGEAPLHWLAPHLALLGGVSQLVLGAGQFFVCAFLATTPPSRRFVALQLAVWNAGTVLVAVGVTTAASALTDVGAILIVTGLALFAGALRAMKRRSLQRARWAVRWYEASAACLVAGVVIGLLLARGVAWPHGSLLGAHLAFNLAGWLGTAIVGTLHTFFPSLTATQLRHPRLQAPVFAAWLGGVVTLAVGAAFGLGAVVACAWVALATAAVLLAANVLASLRAAAIALSLPARLIALAQAFLVAGVIVALVATLAGSATAPFAASVRAPLAILLLVGWIGMTVAGALLHLLAVLARVRHLARAMPGARPAQDRALVGVAGAAIAAWALAHVPGLDALAAPASLVVVAVALLIGVRIVALAARAARPAPRRPQVRTV